MGCQQSSESSHSVCCQASNDETSAESSMNSHNSASNDTEVDLSHFSIAKEILGMGGFGMVRRIVKQTGQDHGMEYALKSMSKGMVLARSTGCTAIMTELRALIMVEDCDYICRLHYAFQDDANLYMVLDYAACGDLRFNIRKAPLLRFSESLSRNMIYQVFLALEHCHQRSILHRGKSTLEEVLIN